MRDRFLEHDPRASRYWELVALMGGAPAGKSTVAEWAWIKVSIIHHLA
jgi:hypothetical protein